MLESESKWTPSLLGISPSEKVFPQLKAYENRYAPFICFNADRPCGFIEHPAKA